MEIQDIYQETIKYAAKAHNNQKLPGTDLPYLIHLSNVCMEVISVFHSDPGLNKELAVRCALLHDIIEDTDFSYNDVKDKWGKIVADGVLALSKDPSIDSKNKLMDSLKRIKKQPKEIWIVKMADRISNLQKPPEHWSKEKKSAYKKEAEMIYHTLKDANKYIADRLKQKIIDYFDYIK